MSKSHDIVMRFQARISVESGEISNEDMGVHALGELLAALSGEPPFTIPTSVTWDTEAGPVAVLIESSEFRFFVDDENQLIVTTKPKGGE